MAYKGPYEEEEEEDSSWKDSSWKDSSWKDSSWKDSSWKDQDYSRKTGKDYQDTGPKWKCSCGFSNRPANDVCGGKGPMGCKLPREDSNPKAAIMDWNKAASGKGGNGQENGGKMPEHEWQQQRQKNASAATSGRALYVRGLPPQWTNKELRDFFDVHGALDTVNILALKQGQRARAGFVNFQTQQDAEYAASTCDNMEVFEDGQKYFLAISIKKDAKQKVSMVSGFSDLSIARQEKRSLYVSGLPFGTAEQSIEAAFQKHGCVEKVAMLPRYHDKNNCSCFVVLSTTDEAMICVKELDGSYFEERRISVNFPKPPKRTRTTVEDQDACVEINGFPATTTATYISEAVSACEFDVVTVKILRHDTMGDTHVALVFLSTMDDALKCVEAFDNFVVQDQNQRRFTLTARIRQQMSGDRDGLGAPGPPIVMPPPPPGVGPPPGSWQPLPTGMPPPPPSLSEGEVPRRQRWDVAPPPPPPGNIRSRRGGYGQAPPPHMQPPPGFPSQDLEDDWDGMEEVPEPPPAEDEYFEDEEEVYFEPPPATEAYFEPPPADEAYFEDEVHFEPPQTEEGYFENLPAEGVYFEPPSAQDHLEPLDNATQFVEPTTDGYFEEPPAQKRQRYW